MKTITLKTLLSAMAIILFTSHAFSQNFISTRIDVQGSRYSDQVWVFAVPTCTRGFDNGYDAFKMLSASPLVPQIFAQEETANFQIDGVPDIHNTYIAFKAGEDTVYTFSFNNENLELRYTELYLVDSVANKTVNVFTSGTKYTFTVQPTAAAVKRFKLITKLPVTVVPPADTIVTPPVPPTDTIPTTPVDTIVPPVVIPTDTIPTTPTDPVVPSVDTDKNKDKKDKKIKIHGSKKELTFENNGKHKGQARIFTASTGKIVKTCEFKANGTTVIPTNLPSGTYVVNAVTVDEVLTTNVVLK